MSARQKPPTDGSIRSGGSGVGGPTPNDPLRGTTPPSLDEDAVLDAPRAPRRARLASRITRAKGAPKDVPRYERGRGASFAYWQILRRGATLVTWFGRGASVPRTITRAFSDAAAARRAFRVLVDIKRAQGYELRAPAPPGKASAPRGASVHNPELERDIEASPNDPALYLVYADWLEERGDPRGELIAVQYAKHCDPSSEILASVEKNLLAAHAEDLIGAVQRHALELTFHLGFIKSIHVGRGLADAKLSDVVHDLLTHPSGRFIQHLGLGPSAAYAETFEELAKHAPKTLSSVLVGEAGVTLGDVSPLLRAVPSLSKLTLSGQRLTLDPSVLPRVKELMLQNLELDGRVAEVLADTTWPELETLRYKRTFYGGAYAQPLFERLTRGKVPKLRSVSVAASFLRYGETAFAPLLTLPVLDQLEVVEIDLPLSDSDVQSLIGAAGRLSHLSALRLRDGNPISAGTLRDLERRLPLVEWSTFGSEALRDPGLDGSPLDQSGSAE